MATSNINTQCSTNTRKKGKKSKKQKQMKSNAYSDKKPLPWVAKFFSLM